MSLQQGKAVVEMGDGNIVGVRVFIEPAVARAHAAVLAAANLGITLEEAEEALDKSNVCPIEKGDASDYEVGIFDCEIRA